MPYTQPATRGEKAAVWSMFILAMAAGASLVFRGQSLALGFFGFLIAFSLEVLLLSALVLTSRIVRRGAEALLRAIQRAKGRRP